MSSPDACGYCCSDFNLYNERLFLVTSVYSLFQLRFVDINHNAITMSVHVWRYSMASMSNNAYTVDITLSAARLTWFVNLISKTHNEI